MKGWQKWVFTIVFIIVMAFLMGCGAGAKSEREDETIVSSETESDEIKETAVESSTSAADHLERRRQYYEEGEYDLAIVEYDQAIELDPDNAEAYNNRSLANNKGELDRAIADLDQSIQLDPDNAIRYNIRGLVYVEKGELDQAIADFREVLRISNDTSIRQLAVEQLELLGASP